MTISEWLDEKEAENVDVSQIELPKNLAFDEDPDETIFYKEIKPCGLFCTENHPFATVERFGHWYYSRGQDKKAGIHSSAMKWRMFTKDRNLVLNTAKARINPSTSRANITRQLFAGDKLLFFGSLPS